MEAGIPALVLSEIVSGLSAQVDNSEVGWQCHDEARLINLFTVGGQPINLDRSHKVNVLGNHGYAVAYCMAYPRRRMPTRGDN